MNSPAAASGPRLELDLWHPRGVPPRRLSLGGLAPPAQHNGGTGQVELVVVAPDADERRAVWLERSVARAAQQVSGNGLVWIFVPRRLRRAAERSAHRAGLVLVGAVMTVPPWPRTSHFIPVERSTLSDAGVRHLGLRPRVARMGGLLADHRWSRTLLRRTLPGCALLAARWPPPASFAWLAELDGGSVGTATVSGGPRYEGRVAVVFRFPPGATAPDVIVKAALDPAGERRLRREGEALARLAADAVAAGAFLPRTRPSDVPRLLGAEVLSGRPAAAVLARAPIRLEPLAVSVARWLHAWNRATARPAVATPALLERVLLAPASRVQEAGAVHLRYVDALRRLATRLEHETVLLTAAHNDLTMANVWTSRGGIGVLDWETATADGLPLTDLWYALADAVSRAGRTTHDRAVRALVLGCRTVPHALARAPADHAAGLALTPDQALLGFHACWLHHAEIELSRGIADGPFLSVVARVSEGRLLWPAAAGSASAG